MTFSVLLSVYEKEKPLFFQAAIESILKQSLLPDEIVIIKDGQLGNDLNTIIDNFEATYPDLFKIISLEYNHGLGRALAIGVEHCSCEYIARMDSDDICDKERFKRQVEFIKQNPDIDVCGMWIEEFNQTIGDLHSLRKVPVINRQIRKRIRFRNPMNHVTVMLKKSSVLLVGNYESFTSYEDYFLWAKMLSNGMKFYNIPAVGVYVRVGNNMIGRRMGWEYYKSEWIFFKTLHEKAIISTSILIWNMLVRLVRFLPTIWIKKIYKLVLRG